MTPKSKLMRQLLQFLAILIFSSTQLSAQIIDTLWSENWEGDWIENWYVDGGTWEVGTPTSGPNTAHEGTMCAATVLAGNYSAYVSTRLVHLKKFTVPSAEQNPRLRFWHWFNNWDDTGYVQIKTEHGSWQNISPRYTNSSSNSWSYSSIDLISFADSVVQIAFYFASDRYEVSSGWYIDEVCLLAGHYPFSSNEGFEEGIGAWSSEGTWEVGQPTTGPDAAYNGDYCLGTALNGNYHAYTSSRSISPPFRVKAASESPALRFWHWYNLSDDSGEVFIKTRTQDNWQLISNRFTGSSSGVWTTFYADLTDYADSIVQIAFHFASGRYNPSSGWYIDDVRIDGLPLHDKIIIENDLAVEWVEPVSKPLCGTGKEQAIIIRVNNNGDRAVSNFVVGYSIDNGMNYVNETVYQTVDPGESLDYVFRRKADMAGEDFYSCQASVNVVYDIDPTNDIVNTTIENDRLIFNIETSDTKCNDATGTAEITSINGRPGPYEIYWTTGDEDLKAENLAEGIYFVTITDALGCSWTKPVTINDLGAPEISDESTINGISCFGMQDGNINLIPVGGVQPYNYNWTNGASTQNISDLRMGEYDVTITDSDDCANNFSFLIEEPAPLKIKATSSDAVCGENNGAAEMIAAGGTQPYFFEWNSSQTENIVTGLAGGLYTAKVTDSNACIDFITVSISEIDAPQIIVTSINPASCGLSDGGINIGVADVTLQYSYSWSDGSTTQDIQNAPAGFYSVSVSNKDESCSASQIIEIPTRSPSPGEICMISVDSVSGENIVVLKDPVNPDGINSVNIYHLSKTGIYQYFDTTDPSSTNTTSDEESNTEITSYRYRITQVDGCGNESEPSPFHETMHTVVTPDLSLKRANLFWNSYKGIEYSFFQIYRYSDLMGLEIIDSVAKIADKDFYTYTDLQPPLDDTVYYVIVVELPEPCNSIKKSATHNTVRSNKTKKLKVKSGNASAVNSGSVRSMNLYPNPNTGTFRVNMEMLRDQHVIMRVFDAQGKLEWEMQNNYLKGKHAEMIKLPEMNPGVHHFQILLTEGMISRSFVVE